MAAYSVHQINTIKRMVNLLYSNREIAIHINSNEQKVGRYIRNMLIQDPRNLPENRIVPIQICVRKNHMLTAIADFERQAKEKYYSPKKIEEDGINRTSTMGT